MPTLKTQNMKFINLALLLIVSNVSNLLAQTPSATLNTFITKIDDTYQFEEKDNNFFFVMTNSHIEAHKTDASFNVVSTIAEDFDAKKKLLVGHTTDTNLNPTLYWLERNGKDLTSMSYDFNTKSKPIINNLVLNLKDENIVTSFGADGIFYVITSLKNTNSLRIIEYNSLLEKLSESQIDLDRNKFYNNEDNITTLHQAFQGLESTKGPLNILKIREELPSAIPTASAKRKIYIRNKAVYITLDNSDRRTVLLFIDLKSKQASSTVFNQNTENKDYLSIKSNSFLIEDKIAQICYTKDFINININYLSGDLIQKFRIDKTQDISFLNGEIYQAVDNNLSRAKTITKTSQFLNRSYRSSMNGLSLFPSDNGYTVCYGGATILNKNQPVYNQYGLIGALVGTAIEMAITSIGGDNLNAYGGTQTILAYSELDKELKHNPTATVATNKVDEIRNYITDNKIKTNYSMIFRRGEHYYLGLQRKKSTTFELIQF